ncbi:MAG: hypothetical protein MZV65_02085 [Chromatiales bacterium]|nr:hypothetical protein [Chromatiales bacterium]
MTPTRRSRPVTRLADGGEADERAGGCGPIRCICVPDLRGVFLVDARILAIEPAETRALVGGVQPDLRRRRAAARRPRAPTAGICGCRPIRACAPIRCIAAIGRDINPLLPHGPAGRRWHALLTEAQMLFHAPPGQPGAGRARPAADQQRLVLGRRRAVRPAPAPPPPACTPTSPDPGLARQAEQPSRRSRAPTIGWLQPPRKPTAWWCWKRPATIPWTAIRRHGPGTSPNWNTPGLLSPAANWRNRAAGRCLSISSRQWPNRFLKDTVPLALLAAIPAVDDYPDLTPLLS